jgi:hypothetical protein
VIALTVCIAVVAAAFFIFRSSHKKRSENLLILKKRGDSRSADSRIRATWIVGSIHMAVPAVMTGALLRGCLFALGHHLFYQSLAGKAVSDQYWNAFGTKITNQQINTAAGTAFAFLVKAALVLAVSTAYTQAFWMAAKGQSQKGNIQVGHLDAGFSALGDVLCLTKGSLWRRCPTLLALAVMVW